MLRVLGLLLGAALLGACRAGDPFAQGVPLPTPARGAVVAEHPLAVAVGLAILDQGGNAADAAVATALSLAVVYPQAGNLGGGGFCLWVPHEGTPWSLDFRETTPKGFRTDLYLDEEGQVVPERSLETPLAVGVPGSPLGLFELYKSHGSGKLSFARLCAPAIGLARGGFPVDGWLARDLRKESLRARLQADPAAGRLFYPAGAPLEEGGDFGAAGFGGDFGTLCPGWGRGFLCGAHRGGYREYFARGGSAAGRFGGGTAT